MKIKTFIIIVSIISLNACRNQAGKEKDPGISSSNIINEFMPGSFGFDLEILKNHHEIVILHDSLNKSMVVVSPLWQGRVMTSSFNGNNGISLGWINHELIHSREVKSNINPFGGEDRFWLGPEGGQFSLFFKPGVTFESSNWQVPKEIDIEPFDLIQHTNTSASFKRNLSLLNYSGHRFTLLVEREINLLNIEEISKVLCVNSAGLDFVAFESINKITNTGNKSWTRETGALSVWILGMFQASEFTTIIIPFKQGDTLNLGPVVNDHYFGKIPPERLIIKEQVMFFKGDGKYKSKLGIGPKRALPYMGTYNEKTNVLTIVNISMEKNVTEYVNSMLEIQKNPFSGDVLNSYNDGPVDNGPQLGEYFELETSSPAAFLEPGNSITHIHRTVHLSGDKKKLDLICEQIFGVGLDEVCSAFQ